MGFAVPALRADTRTLARGGGLIGLLRVLPAAPLSALPAPSRTPASTATIVSHTTLLWLATAGHLVASSATPRHGEGVDFELLVPPGVDDFLYIAGDEGDHADTAGRQGRLERPRNRAADKALGTQRGQLPDFLQRLVAGQQDRGWSGPGRRIGFDDDHAAGHVKNRCDAIVPDSNCRFHDPRALYSPWPH